MIRRAALVLMLGVPAACTDPVSDDDLLFPDALRVELVSPSDGEIANWGGFPTFTWQVPASADVASPYWILGLATEPLRVDERQLANPSALSWMWSPGLQPQPPTVPEFVDNLRSVEIRLSAGSLVAWQDGKLAVIGSGSPLVDGATCYWAVWELSPDGDAVSSSPVFHFTYQST